METVSRDERFLELAHLVGEPLRRYVVRRTSPDHAQDVLAETMLVLWRRLDDVPTDDPLPWSYAVARNCLANSGRSTRRQLRLAQRISIVDPPSETGDTADEHPEVEAALRCLGELDREVVRLWAWEQLLPREIAEVTGLTANAVSIRLHKAKKRLGAELGKSLPAAGQVLDEESGPR
ncbi:MAG: Sigma-70, region 4 type 2 [Marmoricola sp.]|nr:Sigma-70, region 4 type 2 [Marmoricola sp.]